MTHKKKHSIKPIFNWLSLIAFILGVSLSACDKNVVFEQNASIPNDVWKTSQKVKLQFDINDTISQNNFYINIRNTDKYPYQNLYVFVTTLFPNGKKSVDTVGCMLADNTGRWLGKGNGFIFDHRQISNHILYQYQRRFPLKGKYTVVITQAMRQDKLPGIMNVGLRIEKANPR